MIEALKNILKQAKHGKQEAPAVEADRLVQEQAAIAAKADEIAARAETLTATAQERRDRGDRTGASIYLAEAITLLRAANASRPLAHALRHAADIRSEMKEYAVAGSHIEESIRLYRAFDPPSPLDLANALRVSGLNDEREAHASWREAQTLYAAEHIEAGVTECDEHLDCLKHHEEVSKHQGDHTA